jgi:hypothetical protein
MTEWNDAQRTKDSFHRDNVLYWQRFDMIVIAEGMVGCRRVFCQVALYEEYYEGDSVIVLDILPVSELVKIGRL